MARTLDAAKREAILAAAKSILIRDGYSAAKMADIAAEVGVAQGTLYLYFESKEALAAAIGEEFFSRLSVQFAEKVRSINDPEGVEGLVAWALDVAVEERAVLAMARERSAPKSKHKGKQNLVNQIAGALVQVMSRGTLRNYNNPVILAELVLALTRRLIMSHAVFEDEDTEQLKAGAIEVLQHALFDDVTLAAHRLFKEKQKS